MQVAKDAGRERRRSRFDGRKRPARLAAPCSDAHDEPMIDHVPAQEEQR
jgi:hypothetical protein